MRGKSYKKDQSSGNQKKRGKFVDVIGNLKCLQHPKGNEIKPPEGDKTNFWAKHFSAGFLLSLLCLCQLILKPEIN